MPRPQKTAVDYFPHPVKHGRKMARLERLFGNDGYATWFKMLEELGEAEHHCIRLECPHQVELYADRCFVKPARFLEIIECLVRWGEFDGEPWEAHRAIFSTKFVNSVKEIYRTRTAAMPTVDAVLGILGGAPDSSVEASAKEEPESTELPKIDDYSDIFKHPPIQVAMALTGETDATNKRGINALRKYLRILSKDDATRGTRMFRKELKDLYGAIKAGECNEPAKMLNKKLKELTQ